MVKQLDLIKTNDPVDEHREHLSRQLIRLGDMMGDGMHHEPDGKWIEREYRQVMRQLYPEIGKKQREQRNKQTNERVNKMISENKCSCGGQMKQTRSGARTCVCTSCGGRFRIVSKKVKK